MGKGKESQRNIKYSSASASWQKICTIGINPILALDNQYATYKVAPIAKNAIKS